MISVPFIELGEKEWRIIKAIPSSLTISEIASKAGLPQYEVSRKLSPKSPLREKIKVSFELDFRLFNIIPVAVITRKSVKEVPFMRSWRVVHVLGRKYNLITSLVPEELLQEWISNFDEDALIVRAFEREWWNPQSIATLYSNGKVWGVIDKLRSVLNSKLQIAIVKQQSLSFDEADAAIVMLKTIWAFNSLRKAETYSKKYLGKRIPHQTLSRHFRRHVLKAWRGNRVRLYNDLSKMPYRIFYIKGRDAPKIGHALVQLPWFHTAYLDIDAALVSGQPPCEAMLPLYQVLGEQDVSTIDLVMNPAHLEKVIPVNQLLKKLVEVRVRGR